MNSQTLRKAIFIGLFLIPFIPFLVSSSFFFPFITTKAFTWRIIVELVFAAWVILSVINPAYRLKKSPLLYTLVSFLAVVGLANIFGIAPVKSFWSNFERMEGFVTLIHLGMFFVVISSVFKEIDWKCWWNTSLAASFLMVLYCTFQVIGLKTINQGGMRVDGTFGNAIYLAVYMLFHIFIALLFMWREWKNTSLRWMYAFLILSQSAILYFTATRGAILGLIGGLLVIAVLSLFNKEESERRVKKIGLGLLVALFILIGGFLVVKDSDFVTSNPVLSRFSSLTLESIRNQGRYFIWPIAWEGFKDRPILGWGQENFNYVFNKYYVPEMYNLEPWFDRAHNIFLDWMVTGGILGLGSYLALYIVLLYLIWKKEDKFTHTEKSILTGLTAAYFFHNFFVFDHLVSYILFFSLLAYIHMRGSKEESSHIAGNNSNVVAPLVLVGLVAVVYFVNIQPILGNTRLISALSYLQAQDPDMGLVAEKFQNAYDSSRLGRPEVVEHVALQSVRILSNEKTATEDKNNFFIFARDSILDEVRRFSTDARMQLIAGSFLSSVGDLDGALSHLNRAQELMPNKQQIYFELGATYLNKNDKVMALESFKQAYDLAPEYAESKKIYLIGAIYAGDRELENLLLAELGEEDRDVVFDDRIFTAYYSNNRTESLITILEDRIRLDPENTPQYLEFIQSLRN